MIAKIASKHTSAAINYTPYVPVLAKQLLMVFLDPCDVCDVSTDVSPGRGEL